MRDPDLMLNLLREMGESADGRMIVLRHKGMSDDESNRVHHVKILSDAGHVDWISDSLVRITNEGYDFLQAIQQGDRYRNEFFEYINKGIQYALAAGEVVKLVQLAELPNLGKT